MKTLFVLLFSFWSIFCFGQVPGGLPPNAEPGKCYAKCLIEDDIWDTFEYRIPVYIGSPDDKSIKRKVRRYGTKEFEVVKKPRKAPENSFEWRIHTERILIQKGGFTDWREILCAEKATSYVIQQIEATLENEGFLSIKYRENKSFDKEMREALKEFQIENGLPIGNLDLKTLDALNINY